MRRTLPFPKVSRDTRATAPYAVVAVIILMGASMSYAYMAHLNAFRLRMEGAEPWFEDAEDALGREDAWFREAVQNSLATSVALHDGARSEDLVASIGDGAREDLARRFAGRYPIRGGSLTVDASEPRLSVAAAFGTVVTGNALGQQMPQRLPVGVEAVAVATITVEVEGAGMVSRDASARAHRTEPTVMAAYLQNTLEHSLAHEGLVHKLLSDSLAQGLGENASWVPGEGSLLKALDGAVGAVEGSLFHIDTGPSSLLFGPGDTVTGATLTGPGEQGQVRVPMPLDRRIHIQHPMHGGVQEFRLVPWLEWRAQEVDLRTSRLWCGEAGEPGGAVMARLDVAGRFTHRVDAWSGDERVGSVVRDVEFRDHVVAWAEEPSTNADARRRMGRAQVEDWSDLREAMATVAPPVRQVALAIPEEMGTLAEVAMDGVTLGMAGPGETLLENVLAGPHRLTVRSTPGSQAAASFSADINVSGEGPRPVVSVVAEEGEDPEAAFSFWFSVMAALHRSEATSVSHLEHIAALCGYGGLQEDVRADPRGHLGELLFWLEGLDQYLDFQGWRPDDMTAGDGRTTWQLAKEVVSMSKLTIKLLTKLPRTLLEAGRVVVELSGAEGRAAFIVRVRADAEEMTLVEAVEEPDGTCNLEFSTDAGVIVKQAKCVLSALSIIGKSVSIGMDVVELVDATAEGNGTAVLWAVYDLGVDLAQLVISAFKFASDLGLLVLSRVTRTVLSIIGSAISVVTAFLDAYKDAGSDFWGAWELLLSPDTFGDALRTAGLLSALASLVTTVVVTAALYTTAGIGASVALSMAVAAASGVGLIVFGAVLAIWAIFHWDEVSSWVHGSVTSEDVDVVEEDVSSVLNGTLHLMARLNTVDVDAEVSGARAERGVGHALMCLRATSGDPGLVGALEGAPHYHLDTGSSRGRMARSVAEARFWIVNLWREVDDLVDEDAAYKGGEDSEGFPDDRGVLGKDHSFDADVRVKGGEGAPGELDQQGIVAFLAYARPATVEGLTASVRIEGDLFKEALEEWVSALEAIGIQLAEATKALARTSRETVMAGSVMAEADYRRSMGVVELRLPAGVDHATVLVTCEDGALLVDGEEVEGPHHVVVENGTALLAVTGRRVTSEVLTYSSERSLELGMEADCDVARWSELSFGASVLAHAVT